MKFINYKPKTKIMSTEKEDFDKEIENRILNDNGKRFTSKNAIKRRKINKFLKAYKFLSNHKIFKYKNPKTNDIINKFNKCLNINVININPETLTIDENESKNTLMQICLECGPWDNEKNMPSHDYDLNCFEDTFEKAIIELAKIVKEKYGE